MEGTAKRKAKWIHQILAFFTPRKLQKAKSNLPAKIPPQGISIVSAEKVLNGIPVRGARAGIGAFLSVIKGIHLTAALNKETLRGLDRNVRLLVELLEPLVYVERHLFPADLEHQLRRLSRELHTVSQTMAQVISSAATRRRSSSQNMDSGSDVIVFAKDFSLVLDRFRLIALPMYTISTMEAAIRPLGIVSNSSCDHLTFINWIRSTRNIDYRFGLIKTVRRCHRKYRVENPRYRDHRDAPSLHNPLGVCEFLHVGLLNERGIENWLEIEVLGTLTRGTVVFSPTCEALARGAMKSVDILVIQKAFSLVDLAMRVEDVQVNGHLQYPVAWIYNGLESYGRAIKDHPTDQLYGDYVRHNIWFAHEITDDIIRREV